LDHIIYYAAQFEERIIVFTRKAAAFGYIGGAGELKS